MLRVQAQLTEDQARRLKALARADGVSVAELLRRGADLVLERADHPDGARVRALAAVGRLRSGDGGRDVAERHDEHLADAFGA